MQRQIDGNEAIMNWALREVERLREELRKYTEYQPRIPLVSETLRLPPGAIPEIVMVTPEMEETSNDGVDFRVVTTVKLTLPNSPKPESSPANPPSWEKPSQ